MSPICKTITVLCVGFLAHCSFCTSTTAYIRPLKNDVISCSKVLKGIWKILGVQIQQSKASRVHVMHHLQSVNAVFCSLKR